MLFLKFWESGYLFNRFNTWMWGLNELFETDLSVLTLTFWDARKIVGTWLQIVLSAAWLTTSPGSVHDCPNKRERGSLFSFSRALLLFLWHLRNTQAVSYVSLHGSYTYIFSHSVQHYTVWFCVISRFWFLSF